MRFNRFANAFDFYHCLNHFLLAEIVVGVNSFPRDFPSDTIFHRHSFRRAHPEGVLPKQFVG